MKKIAFIIASIFIIYACGKDSEGLTETGFNYKIVAEGDGVKPKEGDYVFFHVDMLADDQQQFDSRQAGQETAIQMSDDAKANVINEAMLECLAHSRVGDSIVLNIPMDSLRNQGFPTDETTQMISYRVRVTEILDEQGYQDKISAEQEASEIAAQEVRKRLPEIEQFVQETYQYISSGRAGSNIQSTDSGLKYIIHEEGTGEQLQPGNQVSVHYYGILKSNGNMFDNSWRRGSEFQFALGAGQVIRGWDEGVALLKKGGKATLIIPPELGYGAAGSPPTIPENSELIFYIEVPE